MRKGGSGAQSPFPRLCWCGSTEPPSPAPPRVGSSATLLPTAPEVPASSTAPTSKSWRSNSLFLPRAQALGAEGRRHSCPRTPSAAVCISNFSPAGLHPPPEVGVPSKKEGKPHRLKAMRGGGVREEAQRLPRWGGGRPCHPGGFMRPRNVRSKR